MDVFRRPRLLRETILPCLLLLAAFSSKSVHAAPLVRESRLIGYEMRLVFDRAMLTWSGDIDASAITISPASTCKWSWSDDTTLTCNFDYSAPMPRKATRYEVRIHGGLWSQDGVEIAPTVVHVDSERPALEAAVVAWNEDVPQIELTSNVAVTLSALRAAVHVVLDDETPLEVDLHALPVDRPPGRGAAAAPNTWQLALPPIDRDRTISVLVSPGLQSTEGPLPGVQEKILLQARVNEVFRVRRVWCAADWEKVSDADATSPFAIDCPAGTLIGVRFSKPLDTVSIEWLKHSAPSALPFRDASVEQRSFWTKGGGVFAAPGQSVYLQLVDAQSTIPLVFPATLAALDRTTLGKPVRVAVHGGDFRQAVRLLRARSVVATGKVVPAVFETMNTPRLTIVQNEWGAGDSGSSSVVKKIDGRNRRVKTETTPPQRDLSMNGGLVQGSAAPSGEQFEVAYAAFNVTAARAGKQVMIWVTDWNDARPLPGVAVELLRTSVPRKPGGAQGAEAQAVTRLVAGVTDADGVAIVDLPATEDIERGETLLVRASQGDARAIAPLSGALDNRRTVDDLSDWRYRSEEGQRVVWGVTDRPLYRAGDTVHYRAWIRQREANHLRRQDAAAAVKLELTSASAYSVIRSWSAQPDAFGSISGTLVLPVRLNDDDYCLQPESGRSESPIACFRVAGYHVNDMWADVEAGHSIAREGDLLHIDASAGYYSGGPAAGARLQMQSLLSPLRIEDMYPDFAGFTFVDASGTAGSGGESFSFSPESTSTDDRGHAQVTLPLRMDGHVTADTKPIPFGQLELTANVSNGGSMWATSAPATIRFSRHRRFVGLKVSPWLLSPDTQPRIEAVVITDEGELIPDADVRVSIEASYDEARNVNRAEPASPSPSLAQCDVKSGAKATACAFRPPHAGRYTFRAESADAAGTVMQRYASVQKETADELATVSHAELIAPGIPHRGGSRADVLLQQPFRKARVLFVVSHGQVLRHWVQEVDATVTRVAIDLDAAWAPGITVTATVLDAATSPLRGKDGRAAVEVTSVDLKIEAPVQSTLLELHADTVAAKPGDDIALGLRNVSDRRIQVTLLVVDDAVRALVPDYAPAADPHGPQWLGQLDHWSIPDWYGLASWIDPSIGNRGDYFARSWSAQPGDERLETITVTGSNIRAVDVFARGGRHEVGLQPMTGIGRTPVARLRSDFREAAVWNTDLTLSPQADEVVRMRLPDNLTRWHVFAWSNDDGDGFDLAEATLTASLPVEVRAELPVRLFPGDRSSVSASTRNHEVGSQAIAADLTANGAGIGQHATRTGVVAANAEQTVQLFVAPTKPGTIDVRSTAQAGTARDGIATSVEVASSGAREHEAQTGWLGANGVSLKLPPLPAGATKATLRVHVDRAMTGLSRTWIGFLRDYPHRCWEQILSRAIGAGVAHRLGIDQRLWPDADAVVKEALDNAAVFQDSGGAFRYFNAGSGQAAWPTSPLLTAYTLRGFSVLRELGYEVPANVERRAEHALLGEWQTQVAAATVVRRGYALDENAAIVSAIASRPEVNRPLLDALWNHRSEMSWFGRAELARALAKRSDTADLASAAFGQLREAGDVRGTRRVIADPGDRTLVLGSNARDQCAVIDTLATANDNDGSNDAREALSRGLVDLYSGGASSLDTQSTAQCLMAILHAAPSIPSPRAPVSVALRLGDRTATLSIAPVEDSGEWASPLEGSPSTLSLSAPENADDRLSYVADIDYAIDQRTSRMGSVGLALQRHYAVLREREWHDAPAASIRQGDWVRVTLTLRTPGVRRFVAISDVVPGGLRPADLSLSGVSDTQLRGLAGAGSPWFSARQVDDHAARFYAAIVPPGQHVIVYYARASAAGDFLAPPATTELMYGASSSARTAPDVLTILPPAPSPSEAHGSAPRSPKKKVGNVNRL